MNMDAMWWMLATMLCVAATGGLVYFVTQSSADVKLAKQREDLAAARATIEAQKENLAGALKNAEESARRQALDDFMADIRIEERHYVREHKALFLTRKAVVRQERIFFRNLPISNWIEQEMPFEEGADLDQLAKTMAIFVPEGLVDAADPKTSRLPKLLRP